MSRPVQVTDSGEQRVSPPRWVHDSLIGIAEIRRIFKLGRTAAYELTHRPGFPEPVPISPRCYRWWASEVSTFTDTLRQSRRTSARPAKHAQPLDPAATPHRITGRVRTARAHKEAS